MIPFNKPFMTGKELTFIAEAHRNERLAGDGPFTSQCQAWLENRIGSHKALLTHSCTAALEMAAILADVRAGDEVIMPAFTFVSTANAFVLRGATPVFVDICPRTLNMDAGLIEGAITAKTKAIVPVHYAGVSCDMRAILAIAKRHNLLVIEDAAQGIMATFHDRPVGSEGHLSAFSFHETKNIISGEGGALLINDPQFIERAEVIREKGTNRSRFFRGQVDKYTWVDLGSSYLPGEVVAAFLWAQMLEAEIITQRRLKLWNTYHEAFAAAEAKGMLRRPIVPPECGHNAHMYYLLLDDLTTRTNFINHLKTQGINCVFHYVPLHSAPYGQSHARTSGSMKYTETLSERLVRLPLWLGLEEHMDTIIDKILLTLNRR